MDPDAARRRSSHAESLKRATAARANVMARAPTYDALVEALASAAAAPFVQLAPPHAGRVAATAAAVSAWPSSALNYALDAAASHYRVRARLAAGDAARAHAILDAPAAAPCAPPDDEPPELDVAPLRDVDDANSVIAAAQARLTDIEGMRALRAALEESVPPGAPPAVAAPADGGALAALGGLGSLHGARFMVVAPWEPPLQDGPLPPLPPPSHARSDALRAGATALARARSWDDAETALLALARTTFNVPSIHAGVTLLQAACEAASEDERTAAIGPARLLTVRVGRLPPSPDAPWCAGCAAGAATPVEPAAAAPLPPPARARKRVRFAAPPTTHSVG